MDYSPANRHQALTDANNYAEFKAQLEDFTTSAYDNLEMAVMDAARSNAWAAHLDTLANSLQGRGFDAATIVEVRSLAEFAKAQAQAQQGNVAAAAGTYAAANAVRQTVSARWDAVAAWVSAMEDIPEIDFFRS